MRWRVLLVLALSVASAVCRNPAIPSTPFTGTWTGTMTSSFPLLTGTARLTFSQAGDNVTGVYSATRPSSGDEDGSVVGLARGSELFITLVPSDPYGRCPTRFTARLDGTTLSGISVVFDCSVVATGFVTLFKQ